ncbi:MAG: hypothetical protein KO464_11245 [Candidatus Methanofastidiosum sp.]|nr:hypothetical protein [Methanofastidiosum sp.]
MEGPEVVSSKCQICNREFKKKIWIDVKCTKKYFGFIKYVISYRKIYTI